jgi:engulfment/cell motility protein 1
MMLVNSLLSHANDNGWEEFVGELEQLDIRQAFIVSKKKIHLKCK